MGSSFSPEHVRLSEYFFLRVPFLHRPVYRLGLDLEKDAVGQFDSDRFDGIFLVFSWYLVWFRVLSLHGLALAGEEGDGFV